jgi:hypothetical protein
MLQQRPHTPSGWVGALRRGAVALGAVGLLSATSLTSVQAAASPAAAPAHGTVTANSLNVRNEPSLKGKVLREVHKGNHLDLFCEITSDNIHWYKINPTQQEWVDAAFVHVDSGKVPPCNRAMG